MCGRQEYVKLAGRGSTQKGLPVYAWTVRKGAFQPRIPVLARFALQGSTLEFHLGPATLAPLALTLLKDQATALDARMEPFLSPTRPFALFAPLVVIHKLGLQFA